MIPPWPLGRAKGRCSWLFVPRKGLFEAYFPAPYDWCNRGPGSRFGLWRFLMKGLWLVGVLGVWLMEVPAHAGSDPKVALKMSQALEYLNKKGLYLPKNAVAELRSAVETAPGKEDALAWLLLGRAHLENNDLDSAGSSVDAAERLGVSGRLAEAGWAKKFFTEFRERFGAIKVLDAPCARITFAAGLVAPLTGDKKKILEERVPGWAQGRLTRASANLVFLPATLYKLGDKEVQVSASRVAQVTMADIGARCDEPSPPLPVDSVAVNRDRAGSDSKEDQQPPGGGVSWLWWVAAGVAVAAGGTAGVLLATKKQVYDYDFSPPGAP